MCVDEDRGFSSETGFWKLYPLLTSPIGPGANPTAVSNADNCVSTERGSDCFHLISTLVAHQKLATLSSKRPRLNGKIRVIGSRIAVNEANGGRKGRKRSVNDAVVTIARCVNSVGLTYVAKIRGD